MWISPKEGLCGLPDQEPANSNATDVEGHYLDFLDYGKNSENVIEWLRIRLHHDIGNVDPLKVLVCHHRNTGKEIVLPSVRKLAFYFPEREISQITAGAPA